MGGLGERRLRAVDAEHLRGSSQRRSDAEAAAEAIDVEQPRAFCQGRDRPPVLALIVEPACLLPLAQIGEEPRAVLGQLDGAIEHALRHSDFFFQPFELARR